MNRPDTVLSNPLPKARVPAVENTTPFASQYFQTVDPDGNVFHVIALKITYDMTQTDDKGRLNIHSEQQPLTTSDQFEGEPNETPLIYESDFCAFKPKCDLFLTNAIAFAPEGVALDRWPVGVAFGDWKKIVQVTGPRRWIRQPGGEYRLEDPSPVRAVELNYANAFGGENTWPEEPDDDDNYEIHEIDPRNTIGKGFADQEWLKHAKPESYPAPQIEAYQNSYDGQVDYPAVSLTPVMKIWEPRVDLAGTYDNEWRSHRWPKPPLDHDYAFWNCAPADQQIPYPKGGEVVNLINLHKEVPHIRFHFPNDELVCEVETESGPVLKKEMVTDTMAIDMQALTVTVVKRINMISNLDVATMTIRQLDRG
jgi:hypothetical protein